MAGSLYWWAHELFEAGNTCKSMLIWQHDPYAIGAVSGKDVHFQSYLKVQAEIIEGAGYLHSEARAAVGTMLSLIPFLTGPMSPVFQKNTMQLLDRASHYLNEWNEAVSYTPDNKFPLKELLKAHLQRALLIDALDDRIDPANWRKKLLLFNAFSVRLDNNAPTLWNQRFFEELGWPDEIKDEIWKSHQEANIQPDLLTALCLYEKQEEVGVLIDEGVDLYGLLLFTLQPAMMKNQAAVSPVVSHLSSCCERALQSARKRDLSGREISETSKATLSWLLSVQSDETLDPELMGHAKAALSYLEAYPSGVDFGETSKSPLQDFSSLS